MSRIYITTAIPYVNGPPHIGHALELVQVDALARSWRAAGHEVRSLTGTDDNALKNVQAADAAGVDVHSFVRGNGDRFIELAHRLDTQFDDIIRTATDRRHRPGVERLWRACAANGDLYLRDYEGRYCTGCEAFLDDDDLSADGTCPEHGRVPETVTETNWFFRLSKYTERLRAAIETNELRIEPASRRNEVLGVLRAGLRDISVSRTVERARGWGVPVPDVPGQPDDGGQVVYVWFDALANYLTALGGGDDEQTWWHEADHRVHVVGKGIIRFHAIYWPAILASAGLPLPTELFVHDYLTVDGAKISKSAGNGIDPVDLVDWFGADALRWWLLSESPLGTDVDFTVDRLIARANEDLANGLGNAVSRVGTLVHRLRNGTIDSAPPTELEPHFAGALCAFDLRRAASVVRHLVDEVNAALEQVRPWELAKVDPHDPEIDRVLDETVAACRRACRLIEGFVPGVAARVNDSLGSGPTVGAPGRAFQRIEARSQPGRVDLDAHA